MTRPVTTLPGGSTMPADQTHVTLSRWALGWLIDQAQWGLMVLCADSAHAGEIAALYRRLYGGN